MSLFVDTSVWSLVLRRDTPSNVAQAQGLRTALEAGQDILTTGIVLQELLQGFNGPRARALIVDRFSALPMLHPDHSDHVDAAALHTRCRRAGVQLATIDALIAQLCIRYDATLLTTDRDFSFAAAHCPLKVWSSPGSMAR